MKKQLGQGYPVKAGSKKEGSGYLVETKTWREGAASFVFLTSRTGQSREKALTRTYLLKGTNELQPNRLLKSLIQIKSDLLGLIRSLSFGKMKLATYLDTWQMPTKAGTLRILTSIFLFI